MAISNARGWEWTQRERDDRKLPLRQVRNHVNKIDEQIRRIKLHIPQFSDAATKAFEPLRSAVSKLSGLDLRNRGRKYQPLSPEEVDCILQAVPALLQSWEQLSSSREYVAAVRGINRKIRKQRKAVAEANAEAYCKMEGVLRRINEGDIGGALNEAVEQGIL